jgi:general secretion pathway protein I
MTRPTDSRGFTLLESVVALAILGIALAGMLPCFQRFMDANTSSEEHSNAVAVGQEIMEFLRQQDPGSLPTSGDSGVQTMRVGLHEYEFVVKYCEVSTYCGTASRHVVVEVRFAGKIIYEVESVFTRLR